MKAGRTTGYPRPYAQYVLLERLGAGGMSEVDLARKVVDEGSFVRFLVVKRIKAGHGEDPSFVRMFKDEARITSELHHANIGTLYDFGKVDDEYYLALEFVPGIDLRRLITLLRERGQRVPVRIALKIVVDVLEALGHAHHKRDTFGRAMGIVHRDVNPRNVMLSIRGEVKLIDFGVAKAVDRLEQTRTDQVKGKFMYMAPEQLTGRPVDHRSDLYATGLLLNELLAGVAPYSGLNHVQVVHRMIAGEPPALPPVPELSDDRPLRKAHDRALAPEPDDRYATAEAMAADLRVAATPLGGLPTNDQLATFLAAVDPELTPRLHAKMAGYARSETTDHPGPVLVEGGEPAPDDVSLSQPQSLTPDPPESSRTDVSAVARTGLLAGSFVVVSIASAVAALGVGIALLVVFLFVRDWSAPPTPAPPVLPPMPAGTSPRPRPEPVVPAPGRGTPDAPAPGPAPVAPAPTQPVPAAPAPVPEPLPVPDPEPVPEPAPVEPAPVEPAPVEPAPRTDPNDVGFVNVSVVDRGVDVQVDGVVVGQSPLVRYRVASGLHGISVPGYTCTPRSVTVRRSQVASVTCK